MTSPTIRRTASLVAPRPHDYLNVRTTALAPRTGGCAVPDSDPPDDIDLAARYQAGDDDAARKIFDRYCEQLMRLAKRRIGQRMVSRFDPEDVIQSAFRTFFVHLKDGDFAFEQENDLFKLLVRLTVRKTLRRIQHHLAAKRDPNAETAGGGCDGDPFDRVAGTEPTPDAAVAMVDELEDFLKKLKPFERSVVELKIQGHSSTEIAEKLKTYDRKVRRSLERVEKVAKGGEVADDDE